MEPIQAILDKRIPIKLLQVSEGENVIFCKNFREELFDSGYFSTKEKDFVHNYITENNIKYIVTDVVTLDDKIYKNVKFKVVVVETGEVPYCTFSPGTSKVLNERVVLPENKITEDLKILEATKQNDLEKKKLEEVESRLENKKNRLIREEQELLEKKRIVKEEKEKAIQEQKQKEKEIQDKYKIIKEAKDDIIASSRQYLEEKIKASSEENKNYARRILDLGGGGGSVAVQYANGGTMNGNLIVNGIINASGGNSNQWNSVYSTVKSLSDSWEESAIIAPLQSASANWNSTYTSVSNTSGSWDSVYSTVKSLSDSWEESAIIAPLQSASANWNSTYTSVSNTSGSWDSVYSTVNAGSASNLIDGGNSRGQNISVGTKDAYHVALRSNNSNRVWILSSGEVGIGPSLSNLRNLVDSSTPNSPRLTVSGILSTNNIIYASDGNSAGWSSVYTTTNNNSAGWNSNYTTTNNNSASWSSVYTTTNSNSANYILDGGNTRGANISIGTNDNFNLTLETNSQIRMTILSSGEVGIGTTLAQTAAAGTGGLTVIGNISARGSIAASASNVGIVVNNKTANYTFTNSDNNGVVHFDTTSQSLTAIFPATLRTDFNCAVMNTGTNSLRLSAGGTALKAIGNTITQQYGAAFVYKDSANNVYAVGRL